MRLLIAFSRSGIERDLFRSRGVDAWSCDLKACSTQNKYHLRENVFNVLNDGWDAIIAHPVCKYLTNAGVRWLYTEDGRWEKMGKGALEFRKILDSDIKLKAIENPIIHKHAARIIGRRQDQVVQPHYFGSPYTKATCWWLEGFPLLQRTHWIKGKPSPLVHEMAPSEAREEKRSLTDPWMALAMADQWLASLNLNGE